MSFTSDIKMELCKLENKNLCCMKAECYGIWLFSKCFSLKASAFVTENGLVARKMAELSAAAAGAQPETSFVMSRRKKPAYRVTLPEEESRRGLLSAFGHTGEETSLRVHWENLKGPCCVQAFLRGSFLACGTVTDPRKEYHLEFSVPYQNLAKDFLLLLKDKAARDFTPSVSQRKGLWVVYLKDSGQIEDLLTYLGASSASMELMQVKMYKEAKNNINRKSNFETANMDKTYSASARQTAAIAVINDTIGIDALPEELQALARLRLEHAGMTLRELSEILGISRSGVNHWMQKLILLGEKLAEEKGISALMGVQPVEESQKSGKR